MNTVKNYITIHLVNVDRYVGSCNILNGFSYKVRVPNKTDVSNLSVFDMITEINEWKPLTKRISH